jgi:5,5'-dehydrodivanillate O-demethylase
MGRLYRYYWHPIAASAELWDKPTKAIRILGEDLTLFRDQRGRLGVIERRCAHRCADLAMFGRPEEDGIRCSFHGWKYEASGACIEQPFEDRTHPEDRFREKATRKAYKVEELGGLIWVYVGPDPAPLLPRWEPLVLENAVRDITMVELPCNWLQARETNADPVHVEYTHVYNSNYAAQLQNGIHWSQWKADAGMTHLKLGFDEFEYGMVKRRIVEGMTEEDDGWAIGHPSVFPNLLVTGNQMNPVLQYHVPIDDTHTLNLTYYVWRPYPGHRAPEQKVIPYRYVPLKDEKGEWIYDKVFNQDYVSWAAQGEIFDRTQEMLGESDRGVIMYRRQLQQQLRIVEEGGEPMCVFRNPDENVCITVPLEGELTHISGEMLNMQKMSTSFEAGDSPAAEDISQVLATWEQTSGAWPGWERGTKTAI